MIKYFTPITAIPCINNIPQFIGIIDGLNISYNINSGLFVKSGRLLYKDIIICIDSSCLFTDITINEPMYVGLYSSVGNFKHMQSGAYVCLVSIVTSDVIILGKVSGENDIEEMLPRYTVYNKELQYMREMVSINDSINNLQKQSNQIFGVSNNGSTFEYKNIIGKDGIIIKHMNNNIEIGSPGVLRKSNFLNEFQTELEKYNARSNIGLAVIDGGTF